MKLKYLFSAMALAGGISAVSQAGTINVASGGDIQAAINSAAASGDEVVLAAGNYTGSINISGKSLVLRGASAANRPVVAFTASVTYGSASVGLAIRGDGTSNTIQDIVFLPGTGFPAGAKGVGTATLTAAATQSVTIQNCLFAPNNGSNQPLFSDPYANTAITGGWPNDIFYLNNGAFLGLPAGVGIYKVTDCTLIGSGREGIVCYPNAAGSAMTVTGSAIAHSARNGIQWGDDDASSTVFTITGTRSKPGLIMRKNNLVTASSGPGVDGINGGGTINIDRLVYTENGTNAGGLIISADNTANVSITRSLFAANTGRGLQFSDAPVLAKTPTVTVAHNTFFANGTDIDVAVAPPTYVIRDNVIAGAGTGVNIAVGVGSKVSLQNNALVTAGPNALTTPLAGEAPASNTGTVTADPQFASTTVTSLAALQTAFNVGSQAYASASTTGGGLSGWGTAPVPVAAVADWSMFQ